MKKFLSLLLLLVFAIPVDAQTPKEQVEALFAKRFGAANTNLSALDYANCDHVYQLSNTVVNANYAAIQTRIDSAVKNNKLSMQQKKDIDTQILLANSNVYYGNQYLNSQNTILANMKKYKDEMDDEKNPLAYRLQRAGFVEFGCEPGMKLNDSISQSYSTKILGYKWNLANIDTILKSVGE